MPLTAKGPAIVAAAARRWGLPGGVLFLVLLIAGCATVREPPLPTTGDPLQDGELHVQKGLARDRVLWEYRTSVVAMRRGLYDKARPLLDDALATLGGIYGPNKSARKARGLFHPESVKTFVGEPYERVMAYYYRGILYWMSGQRDNARACFRSGEFEDSDTVNKTYSGDYVLLDYLDGLASDKLGDDGSDAYRRAVAEARLAKPPPYKVQDNVLFFVMMGKGPTKYATGEYHQQLRFHPGHSEARSVRIVVGGQTVLARTYDDLTYQATTRGGRVMDYVLANKAVFKSTTDVAGNVGLVGGAVLATNPRTQDAGLGLVAFGLLSKILSAATTPQADTRCWDNLPNDLGFGMTRLAPGRYPAKVTFLDQEAHPLPRFSRTLEIQVLPPPKDTVVFLSDQPAQL